LNMLQAPPGVERNEWIEALSDVISGAYLLMQGARNVLKTALLSASSAKGERAILRDAKEIIAGDLAKSRSGSRRYGWLESTYRSLDELTNGPLGEALNASNPTPLTVLLKRPV